MNALEIDQGIHKVKMLPEMKKEKTEQVFSYIRYSKF